MSEFRYSGAYARHYPESRDARDLPIGEVQPGDTRELDEPLDGDWTPAEDDKSRKAKADDGAKAPARTPDTAAGGKTTDTKAGKTGEEG